LSTVFARFGLRLRAVREEVGISQEKLAELAGLHRTYVSSVERGKRNISIENIERLARALGTRMAQLMPDAKPSD
jgi:transcriptional regulator with XRE-family HTH domain